MKKCCSLLLCISAFILSTTNLFAQETASDSTRVYYLVKKAGGAEYYGYILSDDGREVLLETKSIGKIYIKKDEIVSIEALQNKENKDIPYGEFRETGPFTTRYYLTTNAFPIEKGDNYAMIHLYGPEVHFAVTDNLSLGLMTSWIASPIAGVAKYAFNADGKARFALGGMLGSSGYLSGSQGYGGLFWSTLTLGARQSNVSISAGYGFMSTGQEVSRGNQYQFYDSYYTGDKYRIPDYAAYTAVYGQLYPTSLNPNVYADTRMLWNHRKGSFVTGIAGIVPVGKRASFFFDSMVFIYQRTIAEYSDFDVTVTFDDTWDEDNQTQINPPITRTETYTVGKGEIATEQQVSTLITMMPGVRFNKSSTNAFQIALAGAVSIRPGEENVAIPAPMASWFIKF